MFSMINNTIDLYKIEKGSYQLASENFDLMLVIGELMVEFEPKAAETGVRLNVSTQTGSAEVKAEKMLCYPLFSNLIVNAIEASDQDDVVAIELSLDNRFLVVTIHNNGQIPERIHDNFLDKYVTEGKRNGTGLGAYASRIMTEAQQGKIEYTSDSEHGTSIRVFLPLAD